VFLNPPQQFLGLAFDVLKFVIRELGPLLFQLSFDDVAVTFDFEFVHKCFQFGFMLFCLKAFPNVEHIFG